MKEIEQGESRQIFTHPSLAAKENVKDERRGRDDGGNVGGGSR